jgi:hypothetical protein
VTIWYSYALCDAVQGAPPACFVPLKGMMAANMGLLIVFYSILLKSGDGNGGWGIVLAAKWNILFLGKGRGG